MAHSMARGSCLAPGPALLVSLVYFLGAGMLGSLWPVCLRKETALRIFRYLNAGFDVRAILQ